MLSSAAASEWLHASLQPAWSCGCTRYCNLDASLTDVPCPHAMACACSAVAVEEAAQKLREEFPGCRVAGVAADASKPADVERLAGKAVEELGQIVS